MYTQYPPDMAPSFPTLSCCPCSEYPDLCGFEQPHPGQGSVQIETRKGICKCWGNKFLEVTESDVGECSRSHTGRASSGWWTGQQLPNLEGHITCQLRAGSMWWVVFGGGGLASSHRGLRQVPCSRAEDSGGGPPAHPPPSSDHLLKVGWGWNPCPGGGRGWLGVGGRVGHNWPRPQAGGQQQQEGPWDKSWWECCGTNGGGHAPWLSLGGGPRNSRDTYPTLPSYSSTRELTSPRQH